MSKQVYRNIDWGGTDYLKKEYFSFNEVYVKSEEGVHDLLESV